MSKTKNLLDTKFTPELLKWLKKMNIPFKNEYDREEEEVRFMVNSAITIKLTYYNQVQYSLVYRGDKGIEYDQFTRLSEGFKDRIKLRIKQHKKALKNA